MMIKIKEIAYWTELENDDTKNKIFGFVSLQIIWERLIILRNHQHLEAPKSLKTIVSKCFFVKWPLIFHQFSSKSDGTAL
ncbi:unnamed protein product [Blepharisma stoltei]|uniref:Uncharacterized protein n=1 Tax=Blepharisma stoltei TaxID=1481888 RepID=A0AAU9IIT5_9CILI|nr:unnamed protein product [Blepharisma stoltei]